MHKTKLYVYAVILGGISLLTFVVLGVVGYRNILASHALMTQNALLQGYWIARAVEISHRMVTGQHDMMLRQIVHDITQNPTVRQVLLLDAHKRVLIASDAALEGTTWRAPFVDPPEQGIVLHSARTVVEVVFPASFTGAALGAHAHPEGKEVFQQARWMLLQLDVTAAYAHHRDLVTQKVMLAVLVLLFGIAIVFFLSVVQKYSVAHASIEQLEKIKYHLARFVPGTVQRLIEANPEQPSFDKVERDATVLFLDIEQYTRLAEALPPEQLNTLIEQYFSAFLDTILRCGGEINETAGDGLMAIFTAHHPRTHAMNATRAAVTIRAQAERLDTAKPLSAPAILVNIGLCTGPVLLGATHMSTDSGQERLTYTASGMVTNLAARLCALATHGDIYLSETTAHLVRQQFAVEEPTYEHLKHISGETRVYKLV
ncbi:MAG: adenylate/guanylate cyclase domain-containing protein [Candidatus Tectimicrobiota bacterium]